MLTSLACSLRRDWPATGDGRRATGDWAVRDFMLRPKRPPRLYAVRSLRLRLAEISKAAMGAGIEGDKETNRQISISPSHPRECAHLGTTVPGQAGQAGQALQYLCVPSVHRKRGRIIRLTRLTTNSSRGLRLMADG